MEVMRFFRPIKGCRVIASDCHPHKRKFDRIGEVIKVDGNIFWFRDGRGDIDSMIWRFRDGENKFIWFGA